MKNNILILMLAVSLAALGCETMGENTKKGAGLGAVTGAAIGGIVGHQDDKAWQGALIGGAAGATAGGLLGNQVDKSRAANHLSVVKVAEMASSGVPDATIISEIDRTKSKYKLNAETIAYLKDNGVSDKVLNHMMGTSQ